MRVIFISRKNFITLLLILLTIIFASAYSLLTLNDSTPASGQYRNDIPIYSVECSGKKCAITFDCAWGADDIPDILNVLDKYDAKGTFFIVGLWAEKFPDMVKLIHDRGHTVANHGYAHLHMAQLSEEKTKEEITRCTEVLESITGVKTDLFRPPYGEYNASTIKVAKKLSYFPIQWDVDSLDWKKNLTADDIYERVTQKVSPGSIILFHNDTLHTVKVLPSILEHLKNNGYSCVSVSDLIIRGNYKIRYDGRQIKE
jgi:polysaccharide deacetylase family sporulation protein PdaB